MGAPDHVFSFNYRMSLFLDRQLQTMRDVYSDLPYTLTDPKTHLFY